MADAAFGEFVLEGSAAWATAATKHRSKNNSSAVAARCFSLARRATIGRCHVPAGDWG